MFCDIHFPAYLSGHTLDQYLAKGWFRMGQSMFTTSFLHFNNTLFDAQWIRLDLHSFNFRKSTQKILKASSNFKITYGPFTITDKKESLYQKYRQGTHFSTAASLETLLLEHAHFSVFNSSEVCIYKNEELIAMGVFDMGKESCQGIINFYDPTYSKWSLGKLLIASKVKYCLSQGLRFFYPGYVVPGYDTFKYKTDIFLNGLCYFDINTNTWLDYALAEYTETPLEKIQKKLDDFKGFHTNDGLEILKYQFFDVKLYKEYASFDLLDHPYFIFMEKVDRHTDKIIIFNIKTNQFELILCNHLFQTRLDHIPQVYNRFFLQPIETIFMNHSLSDMSRFIHHYQHK